MYLEDHSSKFWITVDKKLEEVRTKCAQPNSIGFTKQVFHSMLAVMHRTDLNNRVLNQIYNKDLDAYLLENNTLLSQAHPTTAQSEINRRIHSRS